MTHSSKNYTEDGGDKTVIGGVLEIKEEATVIGLPSSFTPAEAQLPSEATTIKALQEDFNALLEKLKTAGFMASEP